jgi:DNA-directed RNA polymerase subunit beta'
MPIQSFGQFMLNDILPPEMRADGPINKKELYARLYQLARKDPKQAADVMEQLRKFGHGIATSEGVSITLDDITPDYEAKKRLIRPALLKMQKTDDPKARQLILDDIQNALDPVARAFPGSQGALVRSGAKGNAIQIMKSFVAPVSARTETGDHYPWFIHHSFAEGLRPSEMIANNIESRNNAVTTKLQVTEPGDFSKVLTSNMNNQMILAEDCGTSNGILIATDDSNISDRYLAGSGVAGFPKNTLITPQVLSKIRTKAEMALVRSPMTCELPNGVCQRCYGLDEYGKHHGIGTNVGVRSAQAMAEPLTQFVLSAKHGVRQAGVDKAKMQGFQRLKVLLEVPQSFTNKAVLASRDGKVTKIEKAPQGGFDISIGDAEHYVPPGIDLSVALGTSVYAGDVLSAGLPMANEVVQYKGLGAGRKYIVEQMDDIFRNQGVNLDRRHFEILARSALNNVVVDHDSEGRFIPGDVVNYNALVPRLREGMKTVSLDNAEGKVLARPYLHHLAGTPVTQPMIDELKTAKIKEIEIAKKPPQLSFMMAPISRNPLLNPDWMARLGHRYLKDSLLEGVHYGQRSEIHSTSPIPAYVQGTEFGEGPGGKY